MTSSTSPAAMPAIHMHEGDLPDGLVFEGELAVDTETTGLSPVFNRLCLIQLRGRNGDIHLVKIARGQTKAPNLKKLFENKKIVKILQYARVDMAFMRQHLNIHCAPVFCTKISSKLVRTYSSRHGLKELTRELMNVDISKYEQQSDWAAANISEDQKVYAASDVLYLHALKDKMTDMLIREGRLEIAQKCFDFLPARAELDCIGWDEMDIFAHGKGHYVKDF